MSCDVNGSTVISSSNKRSYDNKVAFITGAAAGIGFGMARAFAGKGMRLALADMNQQQLEEAQRQLAQAGHQARWQIAVAQQAGQLVVADAGDVASHPHGGGAMLNQHQARDGIAQYQEAPATQHLIAGHSAQGLQDRRQRCVDAWAAATVRTGRRYGRIEHGSLAGTLW